MTAKVTVRGVRNNDGNPVTENETITVNANHLECNDYNFMELYSVQTGRNTNSRTLKAAFNTHDVVSVIFEE